MKIWRHGFHSWLLLTQSCQGFISLDTISHSLGFTVLSLRSFACMGLLLQWSKNGAEAWRPHLCWWCPDAANDCSSDAASPSEGELDTLHRMLAACVRPYKAGFHGEPKQAECQGNLLVVELSSSETVTMQKQILCVVLTQSSQISWLNLDPCRNGKPVWTTVAYLVRNPTRQSQPHRGGCWGAEGEEMLFVLV